jgi:sodium/pantothenate symporter
VSSIRRCERLIPVAEGVHLLADVEALIDAREHEAEMDIYTAGILISIVVYAIVGNYAGRKVKHLEDYFVVGRQAPTVLIVGTLVASVLSTNAFLGETGFSYDTQGGAFIVWPAIWLTGYVYGVLFFGRYLRRSRALTVAEFFGQRFDAPRVQAAAGVTIVLGLGGYLLAVTQGTAVILSQLTPLGYLEGLCVTWVSYTLFTLYSGSRGVVITDTMMFVLFTVMSFVALYYIVDAHDGWLASMDGLSRLEAKPELMTWHGVVGQGTEWATPVDYAIWSVITGIAWSLVAAVSPWQSSRYLMARSEHVAIRSACIAAIVVAVSNLALFAAATVVNLSNTEISPPEETMIWAARNMMPPLMGSLLLAGVTAAALSSATTFLSLVGFSVSNDIIPHAGKSDQSMLRFSRWIMLLVGGITLVISLFLPPSIFWLTYYVGTVFASSWGPVAFMSVWSDAITARAAYWGILTGFAGNVIPRLLDTLGWIDLPSYTDPILIGGVISLLVILWVSRLGNPTQVERAHRLALHEVPADEYDFRQMRWTQAAAIGVAVSGLVLSYLLIVFYVFGPRSLLPVDRLLRHALSGGPGCTDGRRPPELANGRSAPRTRLGRALRTLRIRRLLDDRTILRVRRAAPVAGVSTCWPRVASCGDPGSRADSSAASSRLPRAGRPTRRVARTSAFRIPGSGRPPGVPRSRGAPGSPGSNRPSESCHPPRRETRWAPAADGGSAPKTLRGRFRTPRTAPPSHRRAEKRFRTRVRR